MQFFLLYLVFLCPQFFLIVWRTTLLFYEMITTYTFTAFVWMIGFFAKIAVYQIEQHFFSGGWILIQCRHRILTKKNSTTFKVKYYEIKRWNFDECAHGLKFSTISQTGRENVNKNNNKMLHRAEGECSSVSSG